MPGDVTREDFKHLEVRVDVVEREVEGEKMVTRHVLEQTRRNSDDLAAIKSRLDRHDGRFDDLERKVDGLEKKMIALGGNIAGLRTSLPQIVGDVMREVLREHDGRK